jgi:hypothetical protein
MLSFLASSDSCRSRPNETLTTWPSFELLGIPTSRIPQQWNRHFMLSWWLILWGKSRLCEWSTSCAGKGCSCTKPWAPTRWWMLKRLPSLNRSFCSYHPPWRREDDVGTVNRRFTWGKPRRMSAQQCDHTRWRSYLYCIKMLEVIAACLVRLTSPPSMLHVKKRPPRLRQKTLKKNHVPCPW